MVTWNLPRMAWGVIAAGLGLCISQGYAGEYEITDLGAEAPYAYDINTYGEVVGVGDKDSQFQALLWKGALADVDVQDEDRTINSTSASAINGFGGVVGNHSLGSSQYVLDIPFVWHHETGYTPLVLEDTAVAFARDINDKQQVVGNYRIGNESWQAYLWQADRQGAPLDVAAEGHAVATALNNADPIQVVGASQAMDGRSHAFVWTEGSGLRDLGEFQEQETVATGINDHGIVVGWFGSRFDDGSLQFKHIFPTSASSRAFLWSEGQGEDPWTDLGTLAIDDVGESAAYAINNSSQVVGYAETDEEERHAFLYTPEEGMQDLNTLIPPDSGWVLEVAHGINQHGQIVGWGTLYGVWRAFLLTPEGMTPPLDIAIYHSTVPRYPRADEPFTLSSTVVNQGEENVTVRIEHTLASRLEAVSLPENCSQSGQQLECELGDVPVGARTTFNLDMRAPLWGRWEVTSMAIATTENGMSRLAEVMTFLQVARHEPEVVPTYTVVDLGTDVTKADDRGPRINNWGQVALGGEDGAVFVEGLVTFAGGNGGVLYDVNDKGWFAGNSGTNVALWNTDGWTILGGFQDSGASEVFGVNNDNQVVGVASASSNPPEAYVISAGAEGQGLGAFDGGVSVARDINDDGWIVGRSDLEAGKAHAFLYRDAGEGLLDLRTLGGDDSLAYAINNSGVIVGEAETDAGELHAARWIADGNIADLGTLIEGGSSRALDVNDAGIAVGDALGRGGVRRAVRFLDSGVEDLNDWFADSLWQLDKASGINDLNEIVGVGRFVDDNTARAYLALPLSPPLFAVEERLPTLDNPSALATNHSIAFDGDTLAIGNPDDDQLGEQAGAVYIYQRVKDEWVYRTTVRAPGGNAGDQFGGAVALDGKWLAVGFDHGFYLYQGFGATWTPVGDKITEGQMNYSISRVQALALDGETMAIAYSASGSGEERVLIYSFVDEDWQEENDIYIADSGSFTGGIKLQGNRLAVGLWGTLEIYVRQETGWVPEQQISESFGRALAFDDNTIVVGNPSDDDAIIGRGRAYVYKRRDDQWIQHAILPSVQSYTRGQDDSRLSFYASVDEDGDGERFGDSVAVSGDIIAIGATSSNDGKPSAGAVYIYQLHGNQWIEEAKLIASDAQVNQQLGSTVALEDGVLVSGAVNRPDGAVYTYTLNHSPDNADLQLAMFADRNAVGVTEFVTYTLTVTNLSDVAASGIDIAMALPPELDFITASTECGPEAGVIICHVDIVPLAESRQVTITAEALREGTASSQAWVSAYQHDPDRSNNEVSLETLIEEEPPPRIVLHPLCDACGSTIALSPHDALELRFDVEHWTLEPPNGRHVHWWLNDEFQGHIYQDFIDLKNLEAGEHHVVTLRLADANHSEVSTAVSTPTFTIERPSWPGVVIDRPANGAELLLPIQLGYRLDYADVATGPQDFELKLNNNEAVPLENNSSWLFDDLPVGEHTVEIRYKESSEADAVVTFTVRANEEPNEANEKPPAKNGTENTGGGGSLGWLTVMFLAGLVSINGLRTVSEQYCRSGALAAIWALYYPPSRRGRRS